MIGILVIIKLNVKVKLSLCLTKHHAMKTYWTSGGIAPSILDFGTRWRSVVSFTTPVALPPGKEPLVPTGQEPGWAPEHVWMLWWGEEFPASDGLESPDHPARSPVLYHWANPMQGIIWNRWYGSSSGKTRPSQSILLPGYQRTDSSPLQTLHIIL
jgi:hypothetical protein